MLAQWRHSFLLQHNPMLRNQQFILMHPSAPSSYLTPDKRPTPDTSTKGLSSSISRPGPEGNYHNNSPGSAGTSQYRPLLGREAAISQKLGWFQQRTERLRAYLDSSPQLEHQRIQEIFGWTAERPPEETKDKRVLKDLSAKVRALIRENSELRGSTPTEELLLLKKQKDELDAMVDQLRRGESAREAILSEENQYLRDYINRRKEHGYRSTNNKEEEDAQHQGEQPLINVLPPPAVPPQAEVANLRKYVMAYINTVIESNDEKLQAQQKYLQTLDKRLSQLGKYDVLLTHLKFERTVKLQESGRKSKNFTTGVPLVQGDEFQYEPDPAIPSKDPPQADLKTRYFSNKKKEPTAEGALSKKETSPGKQMAALVLRSAQLQEQLSTLQQKYDVEIESHIRDSSDREELVIAIQKLNAEKADLKHQNEDLQQQLRAAHRKISQLQRGTGRFRGKDEGKAFLSIQEELADIKKELISYGVEHYEAVQQQLAFVFAERDRLRRDLQQLQAIRVQGSRFSTATKEIFLLKEKNSQLQQNCRFYEQQIQQYEQQLRQLSQESELQLAKAISRDFKEMRAGDEELQGLKWPRMAHSCMVNSIHRLENIQKQLSITQH